MAGDTSSMYQVRCGGIDCPSNGRVSSIESACVFYCCAACGALACVCALLLLQLMPHCFFLRCDPFSKIFSLHSDGVVVFALAFLLRQVNVTFKFHNRITISSG
jgi:hypothetical protein